MPISTYVADMRKKIGNSLLILPSVSMLIFDQDNRLLLVRSVDTGDWMTVGGQIEPHEPPADAAVRECWEETGLLVRPTRIIGVFGGPEFEMTYPNGDRTVYTSVCFAAEIISGTAKPDHEETSEIGWFSEQEAKALSMGSLSRSVLGHAFAHDAERAQFRPPVWKP